MKKVLIDTNAYAAFKRGDEGAVDIVRLADQLGICSIVLGELLSGFMAGSKEEKNRKELSDFLISPRVTMLMVTNETAEFYSRIFVQLKRQARPIPSNDLWIAAIAMEHGYSVFTYDKHFGQIDNLLTCLSPNQLLP
jgi:predicted nucleic acid-binding protein